jgi:hypothetical protein
VGDRGLGPHVTDAVVDAWGQKTSRVAASLIARTVAANKLVDMLAGVFGSSVEETKQRLIDYL